MNPRALQRFLLAAISTFSAAICACSSTGDCGGTVTTTYAMSLLDDAGVGDDGGALDAGPRPTTCKEACERLNAWSSVVSCRFTQLDEGGAKVDAVECKANPICEGRRPCALRSHAEGSDFAAAAHLEAASVFAFAHLARELRHHGAPRKLIRAARRARRDEIRHARATAALARRRGLRVTRAVVASMDVRDLEAIAIENAVEGCIRETYGAMCAWYRADRGESDVRPVYQRIARDETRHSALAWALDRWLAARLDRTARARVEAARHAAFEELRAELASGGPPVVAVLTALRGLMDDAARP